MTLKRIMLLPMAALMVLLSACNGILGGIYDEPTPQSSDSYGFNVSTTNKNSGYIFVDATSYTEWHYIDLHHKTVITTSIDSVPPQTWDFAIHRYDAKTNGGAVLESAVSDFQSLPDITALSPQLFVNDEWTTNRITIDMSQMMDGIVLYAEDYYNSCLSKWLNVDISTMPPLYTLSNRVYVLRLADGTFAALLLRNFMNDAAVKGFMTIDYIYPIEL